ncbi:hypothetical protein AB0M12_06400 [Nocardia vinacea]|uniref:hypothetical protein n=1 Tax=Nocardia vinacea TaxID=96468 RepID=UPI0034459851
MAGSAMNSAIGWFRYFVGSVELAGAIGLVIPRLSGTGRHRPEPHDDRRRLYQRRRRRRLLVLFVFIAWGRRDETKRLFGRDA